MDEIRTLLQDALDEGLYQLTLSKALHPGEGEIFRKKVRPVMVKGERLFQVTAYAGKQVFHEHLTAREAEERRSADRGNRFGQLQADTVKFSATALVSKKGKVTVKRKPNREREAKGPDLSHNRTRNYILEEGTPVPFLVDLGVQTEDGKVVRRFYDKFRQINRFLEFIEDILPILPKDRPVHLVDFGCGKSYLTFAMYHYLHVMQGLDLRVTGLDLKEDVIRRCSRLAEKYGYEHLRFCCGDIADYTGTDRADMVVTLHACDTATDYALYQAIRWQARVILSVPCCQHEVNGQIRCDRLEGALRYGLIRERMSALFTDALRADLLEEQGYDAQILEFIDMEHTPKNILIRAVKREEGRGNESRRGEGEPESLRLANFLNVRTTLQKLLETPADGSGGVSADAAEKGTAPARIRPGRVKGEVD